MDWNPNIVTVCTTILTAIALGKVLWKKFDKIDQQFEKINQQFEKINQQFKELTTSIHELDKRFIHIEDRLEYSNKIVYIKNEEPKEN